MRYLLTKVVMAGSFFIAISLFLGWLLSPEALVITSNLAGKGAMSSTVVISVACIFSYFGLLLVRYQNEDTSSTAAESIVLLSSGLSAAIALAVFLSTGMLVTAGFTFNETFLYWFPNFGFSALLLLVILLLHLTGEWAVLIAQRIFSTTALLGVFIIILAGVLSPAETTPHINSAADSPQYVSLFATSLLLFLGAWHTSLRKISPLQLFFILLGGAIILSLWQIVAIKYVPGEKLASSTIPYIFVAREAMGQSGRILIGITIIAGTCAAVNYFFSLASKQTHKILRPVITHEKSELIVGRLTTLALSITIAFCLAKGLAGEPYLETYIYGSLLLWLLSVAIDITIQWLHNRKVSHVILPLLFIFTTVYLILTHEEAISLVIFIALALCLGILLTSAVVLPGKRTNQQHL